MVTMYATARDAGASIAVNIGWLAHKAGWTPPPYLAPGEPGDAIQPAGKSGQALWDAVDAFHANLGRPN